MTQDLDISKDKPKNVITRVGVKMDGKNRQDIKPGILVSVVQKQDQRTNKLTEGVVKDILTKSATHPHGIKVRLTSGIVGRVKKVMLSNE